MQPTLTTEPSSALPGAPAGGQGAAACLTPMRGSSAIHPHDPDCRKASTALLICNGCTSSTCTIEEGRTDLDNAHAAQSLFATSHQCRQW